jgi:hypothetical protein
MIMNMYDITDTDSLRVKIHIKLQSPLTYRTNHIRTEFLPIKYQMQNTAFTHKHTGLQATVSRRATRSIRIYDSNVSRLHDFNSIHWCQCRVLKIRKKRNNFFRSPYKSLSMLPFLITSAWLYNFDMYLRLSASYAKLQVTQKSGDYKKTALFKLLPLHSGCSDSYQLYIHFTTLVA